MRWIEIALSVDGEAAEAVADLLSRYGHQGISIEQEGILPEAYTEADAPPPERLTVRAYMADDENVAAAKKQLEDGLRYMNMMYPIPQPTYRAVDDEDWANVWRDHYHPIRLGQRILIRPLWHDVAVGADEVELAVDPGMAFGTGTHPTTQLCLIALEQTVQPGQRVLDLGCGSGILAIAAAKLGAAHVLALDIDELAVTSTRENIAVNGVAEKIDVGQGGLENVITSARRFDLIVVNIIAPVIIGMCANGLGQTVRPGGYAIFSGVIESQAEEVEAALQQTGLVPHHRHQQGDWLAIVCRRPASD